LLLPLPKHADGLTSVEAEVMLESARRILPNSSFYASTKERLSNVLDLLIHLIHMCPYRETLLPLYPYGAAVAAHLYWI
jgi:hypothetical protein